MSTITNQFYCFPAALSPALVGYSLRAFQEGSIPLGLLIGASAVIVTPLALKHIFLFGTQYANMANCYFYPSSRGFAQLPEESGRKKLSELIKTKSESKQTKDAADQTGPRSREENNNNNKKEDLSGKFKIPPRQNSIIQDDPPTLTPTLTPTRSSSGSITGRIQYFTPLAPDFKSNSLNFPPLVSKGNTIPKSSQRGSGSKTESKYEMPTSAYSGILSNYHTPPSGSPIQGFNLENKPYQGSVPEKVSELKKEFPFFSENNLHKLLPHQIFYLALSLGSIRYLSPEKSSVIGISNSHCAGTVVISDGNTYVISALQALCYNEAFLSQLKNIEKHLNKDLLKNIKLLLFLFKNHKIEKLQNSMKSIKSIIEQINPPLDTKIQKKSPIKIIEGIFTALDINKFTLVRNNNEESLGILRLPVTKTTLVQSISDFFTKNTYLKGDLPDVFTIELDRSAQYQNLEVEIEHVIDFGNYFKEKKSEKYLYKISSVICYLEDESDNSLVDESTVGRYVTFIRTSNKQWLLCEEDEIYEVTKPYFKGGGIFIFEKVKDPPK